MPQPAEREYCRCTIPVTNMEAEATYRIGEDGRPIGTGMRSRLWCSECGKDIRREPREV